MLHRGPACDTLSRKYGGLLLIHSKEVWLQPIIIVRPQCNKCTGIKSVKNSILLNILGPTHGHDYGTEHWFKSFVWSQSMKTCRPSLPPWWKKKEKVHRSVANREVGVCYDFMNVDHKAFWTVVNRVNARPDNPWRGLQGRVVARERKTWTLVYSHCIVHVCTSRLLKLLSLLTNKAMRW